MKFRTVLTAALCVAVAILAVHAPDFAAPIMGGGSVLGATLTFPVIPKTLEELEEQSTPEPTKGGTSEAVPWVFYDTVTYTSGTDTSLTFFNDSRSTRQLSNLNGSGQLPDPQFFEIYGWAVEPLVAPADDAWDDVWDLIFGGSSGGPTFKFNLADKAYGPFPLSQFGTGGGITGFGYSEAASTGATEKEFANNGHPGAGWWWVGGAITIPPLQGFNVELAWSSAQTLAGGNADIRVAMAGALHRRVL